MVDSLFGGGKRWACEAFVNGCGITLFYTELRIFPEGSSGISADDKRNGWLRMRGNGKRKKRAV